MGARIENGWLKYASLIQRQNSIHEKVIGLLEDMSRGTLLDVLTGLGQLATKLYEIWVEREAGRLTSLVDGTSFRTRF